MHRKILAAINLDHRDGAVKALRAAVALATIDGAEVIALTVAPHISDNLNVTGEDFLRALIGFVNDNTDEATEVKAVVRKGAPHRAIGRAAAEFGCDLIVINARNPRISDYLIGSTATHVVLNSECSIYVVRE